MKSGDFIRAHNDLYGGKIGYNLYYPKKWSWDWGGIVNYYKEDNSVEQIYPKYNRMVFRNDDLRITHFVTHIAEYALGDRYTINGWASDEDLSSGRAFGEYYEHK